MQPSQQQPPGSIQINPQAQYIPNNQFGQQVVYTNTGKQIVEISQPPQNRLIMASYICSAIGLLVFPFLGPIGFFLALIAQKNGDNRGKAAMVFAGVVTLLSLMIIVLMSHTVIISSKT